MDHVNDRSPNFYGSGNKFFLVRCFSCTGSEKGKENYSPAVVTGECAWCGWRHSEEGMAEMVEDHTVQGSQDILEWDPRDATLDNQIGKMFLDDTE